MFNPVLAEQLAAEHVHDLERAATAWRRTTAEGRPEPAHRLRTHATAWRVWFASLSRPNALGCEA